MNIANKLTVFRIILVPFFVVSLTYFGLSSVIPLIIFLVAALTDMLDGYFARSRGLVTTFGKFLDPIADKLLAMSAFIMLIELGKVPGWAVLIIVGRELLITGFRVIAASNNITIAASPFGKIKTITQFTAIVLILGGFDFGIKLDTIMMYVSVLFTILSGIDYIIKNLGVLDLDNI